MKSLVGYTGFVGGNLKTEGVFDALYNSKNIEEAFGSKPEVLYFSGVRAEKFLANTDPKEDYAIIENAMRNIERIEPQSVVLISTVDVYQNPADVDETTVIATDRLHPYGLNRYRLEQFVSDRFSRHLILRLPALYGNNMKKNFIYDMIKVLPSMLTEKRIRELDYSFLSSFYLPSENHFFRLRELLPAERKLLREYFEKTGFSALSFTDSRSIFQFYNLSHLYSHAEHARREGIHLLNITTEPCGVEELYRCVSGHAFENHVSEMPVYYNMRSVYAEMFGGRDGYYFDKLTVMTDIRKFVQSETERMLTL